MHFNSFVIKKCEGTKFAKLSGDDNIIHINKTAGYNSMYGCSIVHGVLVILKFLKKIKLIKNYSFITIQFQKGFRYNIEIRIKKIKKNKSKIVYELIQQNEVNANIEIGLLPKKFLIQNFQRITYKKNYFVSKKIKKKFTCSYIPSELKIALCYLSKYVGTVYPGKNSLIKEINIFNNKTDITNRISLKSSLLSKVFPLIANVLAYKNYNIEFKTIIRPVLKIELSKPNKKILKEINSIKENILIIGASSDSVIPVINSTFDFILLILLVSIVGNTSLIRILSISLGTPGRQTIFLFSYLINTPGAVPTLLFKGIEFFGSIAIFFLLSVREKNSIIFFLTKSVYLVIIISSAISLISRGKLRVEEMHDRVISSKVGPRPPEIIIQSESLEIHKFKT